MDLGGALSDGAVAGGAPMTARYRKLPGRRRGFIRGASVWMGELHLLSVRSMRFREEYKRFHLGDVQAIVVASAPRFHISTRAFGIALLLLISYPILRGRAPGALPVLWIVAALAVVAWVSVSAWFSCRCRIHTAVSSDELPSVYRTWTARRFLARVEPRIVAVQGVVEGGWAEAAEQRSIGVAAAGVAPAAADAARGFIYATPSAVAASVDATSVEAKSVQAPPIAASAETDAPVADNARSRTWVSDVFVASLLASGLAGLLSVYAHVAWLHSIEPGCLLIAVIGAVVIFVQRSRRRLKAGMKRLAIAELVLIGAGYYASTAIATFAAASHARPGMMQPQVTPPLIPANPLMHGIYAGLTLVLAAIGVALVAFDRPLDADGIKL
jgi:hypothetical protein